MFAKKKRAKKAILDIAAHSDSGEEGSQSTSVVTIKKAIKKESQGALKFSTKDSKDQNKQRAKELQEEKKFKASHELVCDHSTSKLWKKINLIIPL
mmetsp:Transcript_24196/g.27421  ORF Transcript_24196/g.27421 Transcript_24196/m.27421 type:complete len:96 (+) Transcript_24196:739-1026(+)